MNRSTLTAVVTGLTAFGLLTGPAFAKTHAKPHAKPAPAKAGKKMAATTFVCRHGCGKKITVKSEGEWKKTCGVCGCKKTNMQCKPDKK
jgi:hypothetical protein